MGRSETMAPVASFTPVVLSWGHERISPYGFDVRELYGTHPP